MHVLATAGHVDHGKSTLVAALTGVHPDRWAEERRRGLSIGLGFAATTLPGGEQVAFVDVPGHERFVPTMLAGVGPVPAVVMVVAADEGWMAQSAEHLAAIDALNIRHGLLVVTRTDLADPEPARRAALARIAGTSLGRVPSVAVGAPAGIGLAALRRELATLVAALPPADPDADVRLWVDRSFSVPGAGTVVTGTLAAGTLRRGHSLVIASTGTPVRIRGLQVFGRAMSSVAAVARVAVNLRGVDRASVSAGDALLTPASWRMAATFDVVLAVVPARLPRELTLHLGSAAVPGRARPLGSRAARLELATPLPLRVGDRVLLREPGGSGVVCGAEVADVRPPALHRRHAVQERAADLTALAQRSDPSATAEAYLRHRGFATGAELRAMGLAPAQATAVHDWYVDGGLCQRLVRTLAAEVEAWRQAHPLDGDLPAEVAQRRLELPDAALLAPLVRQAGLVVTAGRIHRPGERAPLPDQVETAIDRLAGMLRQAPFAAPEAARLAELGLGPRPLAAAVRAGRLVKVGEGVFLLPDVFRRAVAVLAGLPAPFTLSAARQALGTSRRVAVPLMEHLDRLALTQRLPDGTRRLADGPQPID